MKNQVKKRTIAVASQVLAMLMLASSLVYAANDPSIKGDLRTNIGASMNNFIKSQIIDNNYRIYDPVEGKLHTLKFEKLHEGIVKKGNFYVSCADFTDTRGRKFDLDFLVLPNGDKLHTTQAVIHAVAGKKRKYHLEE